MVVRIEDAPLTRGREFRLFAYAASEPECVLYAFDPVSQKSPELDYTLVRNGDFYIYETTAPSLDGYLLARIGSQKIIKRIGAPVIRWFLYGYRPGYTLDYRFFDADANVVSEGTLDHLIDAFYGKELGDEVMMADVAGRKILIGRNISRLAYEVSINGGSLASTIGGADLPDVDLPDVALPDLTLPQVSVESTLPEVIIREL